MLPHGMDFVAPADPANVDPGPRAVAALSVEGETNLPTIRGPVHQAVVVLATLVGELAFAFLPLVLSLAVPFFQPLGLPLLSLVVLPPRLLSVALPLSLALVVVKRPWLQGNGTCEEPLFELRILADIGQGIARGLVVVVGPLTAFLRSSNSKLMRICQGGLSGMDSPPLPPWIFKR